MTTFPLFPGTVRILVALLLLAGIGVATEATSPLLERVLTLCAERSTPAPAVAAVAGQFQRGAPVYRLPAVTVTATRGVAPLESGSPKRLAREPQPNPLHDRRAPS